MSLHSFDPDVAARVGVNAAVVYQNFLFWSEKNHANRRNIIDGYVWTYNSRRAMRELFPYLTESQIKTAVSKLVESGLLIVGEHNKASMDKTNWYAVTASKDWPATIGDRSPMEWSEIANGLAKDRQAIPDGKPDTKPDGKLDISDRCIFDAFNEVAEKSGWPKVMAKTKERERAAANRMKDCGGFEAWLDAIHRAARSDFLTGRATGTTPASFDWLNSKQNFAKLMEGNYDNRTGSGKHAGGGMAGRTQSASSVRGAGIAGAVARRQLQGRI